MGWYFATCSMWGVFWKGFLQGVCTEVDGEKFFRKVSELLNAVSRDMYIYIYIYFYSQLAAKNENWTGRKLYQTYVVNKGKCY